jgi:uncharacterized protein YjdB
MFNRACLNALLLAGLTLTITSCTSSDPSLTSITVTPTTVNFGGAGVTSQLTAMGSYTHPGHPATLQDITDQVTWATSANQCVTVSKTGFITSGPNVCTNILVTASMQGFPGLISGSMTVNVTQPTSTNADVVSVSVLPATQTVASLNVPIQYEAIGTTSGGITIALGNFPQQLKWASSNATVATINATSGLATTTGSGTSTITATFTNADGTGAVGSAVLTVAPTGSPEPLTAITVAPNAQTATVVGQQAQFLAIATTGSGTSVNLTNQSAIVNGKTIPPAVWTSSNPSVATIGSATGLATAVSAGAAVITAIATNPDGSVVTGTATYTVTVASSAEPLTALTIQPSTQSVATAGQTAQFLAIGTFAANSLTPGTQNMANIAGYTMAWYSSNPSVGTVNPVTGLVTATGQGVTAITAIATNNTDKSAAYATATFTVTGVASEPLQSLVIVPGTESVAVPGQTGQYIAIGTFTPTPTQPLTQNLTSTATWSSSNTGVATVCTTGSPAPCTAATNGLVTAVGQGTTAIIATSQNPDKSIVTATATFTVVNAASEPVSSLTIVPASQTVSKGQNAQFIALSTNGTTGLQSDVTTAPSLTWSSSIPTVASVGANTGLVLGLTSGSTTITAQYTNPDKSVVTATASLTVTVAVAISGDVISVTIQPADQADNFIDQTTQFIAIGTSAAAPFTFDVTNCDGTSAAPPLCNGGTTAWASSNVDVATINTNGTPGPTPGGLGAPAGLATMIYAGTTAITATFTNHADQSIATGVASLSCPITNCILTPPPNPPLVTLTVFGAGNNTGSTTAFPNNSWLVTAPSATGEANAIHCGPGSVTAGLGASVCVGTYPIGTQVTLTTITPDVPGATGTFGGWASGPTTSPTYCTPVPIPSTPTGTNSCTILNGTMGLVGDANVVAIFND